MPQEPTPDYKAMYFLLFHTITGTLEHLDALRHTLITAQQQAEELYLSTSKPIQKDQLNST